jgi:hypothetical protein
MVVAVAHMLSLLSESRTGHLRAQQCCCHAALASLAAAGAAAEGHDKGMKRTLKNGFIYFRG